MFPISSCCAMLLSAQKCESQTVDGVSCLFIFYFNTPIFEIFKTLQKGLVRLLQKFICCLLKTKQSSHVWRKVQNSFEICMQIFLCLSPTILHLHGKGYRGCFCKTLSEASPSLNRVSWLQDRPDTGLRQTKTIQ